MRCTWLMAGMHILVGLVISSVAPAHAGSSVDAAAVDEFLARHWSRPLAPQGEAPARLGALERSLTPGSCGACHPAQFADWRTSVHARAMGPGLMGQFMDMAPGARAQHQSCLRCHAPLSEQADSLLAALASPDPAKAGGLHAEGLVCAACHVRGYQWYGPTRRDGSTVQHGTKGFPHNAWRSEAAFEDSKFCAACHQFQADEYALNGKLLENTYEEWKVSPYAARGESCQSCHMPDRRHVWRGIHDPDTVRSGVSIEVSAVRVAQRMVTATLRMTNTGVGHLFPTYVTPMVFMEAVQIDAGGGEIGPTLARDTIGREVSLNLAREVFDTRIAPLQSHRLDYREALDPRARRLLLRVRVEPDAFYERFYEKLLNGGWANNGRAEIEAALRATRESPFTIFESSHPLRAPK